MRIRKHLCSRCESAPPRSGGYCRACANAYMRERRAAGKYHSPGGPYKMLRVDGHSVRAHRKILGLADSKIYGFHLDGNGLNNDPANLVAATPTQAYALRKFKRETKRESIDSEEHFS